MRSQRCYTIYFMPTRGLPAGQQHNSTNCLTLQAQVEATEKLLSAEQAANAGLRAQTSELTSELGSVKEALADTAAQLEEERSSGNELRSQLEAIKSEYITAGARLIASCLCVRACCESGVCRKWCGLVSDLSCAQRNEATTDEYITAGGTRLFVRRFTTSIKVQTGFNVQPHSHLCHGTAHCSPLR
jgi:hypothetical protein